MKIKSIKSQSRRDIYGDLECEACGAVQKFVGYDDHNYHVNVVPHIKCKACNKSSADMADHQPMSVAGYTPQSDENVMIANELKHAEERYMRVIDKMNRINMDRDAAGLGMSQQFDPRFMALARTHMQTANMFAVRAVFQPQRIALPEDTP